MQMLERGVSISDIDFVLHNFSISSGTRNGSTMLSAQFPDNRTLKVWIVGGIPLVEPVIIKSVAWMEQANDH